MMNSEQWEDRGAAPQEQEHIRNNYQRTNAHLHLHTQQQQQEQYHLPSQQHPNMMPSAPAGGGGGGGGLMYNNLIPGHYRYGARPPAPPPGPLSHFQQQQQHYNAAQGLYRNVPTLPRVTNGNHTSISPVHPSQDHAVFDVVQISEPEDDYAYDDCVDDDDLSVVAIPSDLVAYEHHESEVDDKQYYRPFRHHQYDAARHESKKNSNKKLGSVKKQKPNSINVDEDETKRQKPVDLLVTLLLDNGGAESRLNDEMSKNDDCGDISSLMQEASSKSQMARSMTNALATKKFFEKHGNNNVVDDAVERGRKSSGKVGEISIRDNDCDDLYVATSNAHLEAAHSYRKVYRTLLGLSSSSTAIASPPEEEGVEKLGNVKIGSNSMYESSYELAKSMLMLSSMHARTAKSLLNMGLKWNINMPTSMLHAGTDMKNITNNNCTREANVNKIRGNASTTDAVSSTTDKGKNDGFFGVPSSSLPLSTTITDDDANHERLRMTVRKALDTANHEEDITNSTFLGVGGYNRPKSSLTSPSRLTRSKNRVTLVPAASLTAASRGVGGGAQSRDIDDGVNPIDDLMKLENELRIMDAKLELGNSVANLGRPDGSFCVVPPGSSYMSSSSMWTSGIFLAGNAQQQHQQQHSRHQARPKTINNANEQQQQIAGVRSRANHLQNFLGGGSHAAGGASSAIGGASPTTATTTPLESPQMQHDRLQIVSPKNNSALDQSWWGVGGQGSILASSTNLSAAAIASSSSPSVHQQHFTQNQLSGGLNETHPNYDGESIPSTSLSSTTNAKQLMRLMDSLNRLGNENAQLMRMVEDAKSARAEAQAAKEMMIRFKTEYGQRFEKVKEALRKFGNNNHSGGGGGNGGVNNNPVGNSAFMKSASLLEIQKRDQMIKQLSTDLKKEREDCKKKDNALQKYEAFYREVKARSAEKARQRQQQLEKDQQKQHEKRPP